MKLVLLGPPGAGKGTQAKKLEAELNLKHISTGDLFRSNIKNKTELGQQVESYLQSGKLVPDALTIALVWDRLDREKDDYLLDGFPRTIEQADALKKGLEDRGTSIDYVVLIDVDEPTLVKRLSGRRVCPKCGASYHLVDHPPKVEGICDVCGTALEQRPDDTEETAKKRIAVYREQTEPLVEYYQKDGTLLTIDGNQSVDDVFAAIREALQ